MVAITKRSDETSSDSNQFCNKSVIGTREISLIAPNIFSSNRWKSRKTYITIN